MADTGAPWNLPYPLPTDLVRDGAQAIEDLAEAVADGLDAAALPGIGSNVVQTVKTDEFSTSSGSYVDVTGLTVTITPSSATSKVLVIAQYALGLTAVVNLAAFAKLAGGNTSGYVGDSLGSLVRSVTATIASRDDYHHFGVISYLDSPATTSPVTYSVQVRRGGTSGTIYVNRINRTTDNFGSFASSITAIEVAA